MTTTIAKRQNGNPSVSFGNVVDNIFQNSLRHFFDDNFWNQGGTLSTGSVPVNVRETAQHYEMDVIAPGCSKEDFKIGIEDNFLTISFNHKEDVINYIPKTNRWITIGFFCNCGCHTNLLCFSFKKGLADKMPAA